MRLYTLARLSSAAGFLALSPAVAPAQSESFDFSTGNGGGFTPSGLWVHGDTPPAPGGLLAWSIPTGTEEKAGLTSPAITFTVTTAGPITGTLSHRFNFGFDPFDEALVAHDGWLIEYRIGATDGWGPVGGSLVSSTGGSVGDGGIIAPGNLNPLVGRPAFTAKSNGYDDTEYRTTTFQLGGATAQEFESGEYQIELRYLAGLCDNRFTADDPNWQIESVSLRDARIVPEPAHVLGVAALAVVGFGFGFFLRRRLTSPAASRRKTAA